MTPAQKAFSQFALFLMLAGTAFGQASFWALTASTFAVTAGDYAQTTRYARETGEPWLYGTYPYRHRVRVGFTMGGEALASALGSRFLHRHKSRFWMAPEAAVLANHAEGIIRNCANLGCR
jgi:hypothetical protein